MIKKRNKKYYRVPSNSPKFWIKESGQVNNDWYDSVQKKSTESLIELLLSNKAVFIVNRSFFLEKSYLISAAWVLSKDKKRVAEANFIITVIEQY